MLIEYKIILTCIVIGTLAYIAIQSISFNQIPALNILAVTVILSLVIGSFTTIYLIWITL